MILTGISRFWTVHVCEIAKECWNINKSSSFWQRRDTTFKAICSTLSVVRCFVQSKSHSLAEIGSISAYRVHLKAETEPISELLWFCKNDEGDGQSAKDKI